MLCVDMNFDWTLDQFVSEFTVCYLAIVLRRFRANYKIKILFQSKLNILYFIILNRFRIDLFLLFKLWIIFIIQIKHYCSLP